MSDRILAATRKGLFTIARGRAGWSVESVAFLGDSASMVLPDSRDGSVYVALGHGHFGVKLHRSPDGGRSWEETAAPAFPARAPGEEPWIDTMGRAIPDSVQLVWSLECAGPDRVGSLWCGTIPGGLFHSADAGRSWELVRGLWDHPKRKEWFGGGADWPGIHSICVDPADARRVAVGVSCGGVWITTDGGTTWDCRSEGMWAAYMPPDRRSDPFIQDPHRVVQCGSNTAAYWAQHHNGVFRSIDGAQSWQEVAVTPSSFGFAVAVHPKDGDIAWLVPGTSDERRIPVDGRVVVSRTQDGGRTFETLRNGLPQAHAYDLTFRHGLDIDASGERLAFGTTTGSLWVTEDQGDSWQAVSQHLPPVYCVRFVEG
jgi:photosystem II stability/assembly factor-like uncharacterized protein